MPLDDLFADGQADAGTGELLALVQPLKHPEDLFEILRLDSEAVVLHGEGPFTAAIAGGGGKSVGRIDWCSA